MKKRQIAFFIFLILSLAINVFIIIEGATGVEGSAAQSMGFTQAFIDFVAKIDPNSPIVTNPELTHKVIRKLVGHFLFFGLSGILTTLSFVLINDSMKKKVEIIIMCLLTGLLVAFTSELVQLIAPGRFFAFTDVLIDYSGYVLFGAIVFIVSILIYRHKLKKENQ